MSLPDGVFPAKVNSAELILSRNGRPQFQFKLAITEPAYAGAVRTEWISLQTADPSKMPGLMQVWAGAFMSIGVTAEQIPAMGQVSYEQIPGVFVGRDCYVEVKPKRKMDGSMTQSCSFVKPDTYAVKRKAQDAAGGPSVTAEAPAAAPPALSVLPTMSAVPAATPAVPIAASPVAASAAPASSGLAALLGGR